MTSPIRYFEHPTGTKISYFIKNDTVWISGKDVGKLLHYAKPQAAIQRHVSPCNQKRFFELSEGFRGPKSQPQQIFINFEGLQELFQKNSAHPLAIDWATPDNFLNTFNQPKNSLELKNFSEIQDLGPEGLVLPHPSEVTHLASSCSNHEHERIKLKQQYTQVANSVVELLGELGKQHKKESLAVLEQVFLGFRNL
uniref:Uncharacterized protein orf195 n=1 Tax=Pedinomonas minor TaxID=3159 RepID=C7BES2_PEDMN|nr:hypothetical protein PrmiC_p072 [Pedinomonas minor]YP_005089928.1 hypothetical protein PrmiC_p080 [Pedinomonas minor]ACQ90904.1 hypothetical protein [Pedinomonas minor]ACQ90905.1 hypothetical protein [Pedinomonas minor]